MSTPTAALHPFSAVNNLLLVGKWFSDGFFGDLHRQLLFTSPTVLHHPPLKPENCNGWFVHAPGVPTNEMSSGDEVATRSFLPAQLGSNHHRFPTPAQKGQKSSAALPPAARLLSPVPPRDAETPWSAASQTRNVTSPFQR